MRSVRASLTRPGSRGHAQRPSIRSPAFLSRPDRSSLSSRDGSNNALLLLLPPRQLLSLRLAIVILVLWLEYWTFWAHASISCPGFDDSPLLKGRVWDPALGLTGGWTADSRWKDAAAAAKGSQGSTSVRGFHVLVVADPQLLDMRAYPDRSWIVRWLGVQFTDLYARKSWSSVRKNVCGQDGRGIDAVVWLGDLLDEGRKAVRGADYAAYVQRFHRTFPTPRERASRSQVPVVYLPGNHDLGLHPSSSEAGAAARERFMAAFGPLQGKHDEGWAGWEIVWIDSMALLEGDEAGGASARQWVERLGKEPVTKPRVLLSHIPLFRPEGTSCGLGRESSRVLHQGQGQDYQNELDEETTKWLLERIKPTIVYSGDDHDLCVVQHPTYAPESSTPVVETTVKAFSMAMGVRRPGYHLLTLFPPLEPDTPSSATYTQVSCTLPDQLGIWLHVYVPLVSIVLAALLLPKVYRRVQLYAGGSAGRSKRGLTSARSNGLPVTRPLNGDSVNGVSGINGHSHKRSLSQKLLGGGGASAFDGGIMDEFAEDQDSQFPTFPFSPTSPGDEYGYHSPLDSDDIPTASANFLGGGGASGATSWDDGDPDMRPSLRNVRRVSRVWSWDGADDDDREGDLGTGSVLSRLRHRAATGPATGSEALDTWLARRLGPVMWTRAVTPLLRIVRFVLILALWLPRGTLRARWIRRAVRDGLLGTTLQQFIELAWPGIATWVLVNWVWFGVLS